MACISCSDRNKAVPLRFLFVFSGLTWPNQVVAEQDTDPLISEYNMARANILSTSPALFSFCQTEPTDNLSSSWDTTAEKQQNVSEFADSGDYFRQDAEDFLLAMDCRPEDVHSTAAWTQETPSAKPEPMCQSPSKALSTGSRKSSRTSKSSAKKTRSRTVSALTLTSAQLQAIYERSRPVLEEPSALRVMDMQRMDRTLCQDLDTLSVSGHVSPLVFPGALTMSPGGVGMGGHVNPQILDAPPASWARMALYDHRAASPESVEGVADDVWSIMATEQSPESVMMESFDVAVAPSTAQKPDVARFLLHDARGLRMNSTSYRLASELPVRRATIEGEVAARNHALYKEVQPGPDGLYHCPWEGQPSCNHRAEKLKCTYDKFIDSHLKPYRCKVEGCQNARFSSTACLLRHEREAHAMHGHGEKPFMCTAPNCERSLPGRGFPRQWNLRDHMRRVHNHKNPLPPLTPASPTISRAGRKKQNDQPDNVTRKKSLPSGRRGPASFKSAKMPKPSASSRTNAAIDQWHEHRRAIEILIQHLTQPEDIRMVRSLKEAQNHLAAMASISHQLAGDPLSCEQRSLKQSG